MKRVLFIAYLYPPVANSGTRRSLEFVNHLPDLGWEPIVLTIANPPTRDCEPDLLNEVRPGTRIERTPLVSESVSHSIAHVLKRFVDPNRLAPGIEWRIRRMWQVPDEGAMWRGSAIRRALRIFQETGFDAIYASGWPWTSFLVAAELGRMTKRPYVLDYRDLWKPSGADWERSTLLQRCLNPRLERKAARNAAAIVCTTEASARVLAHSLAVHDVVSISNGFDPDDFVGAPLREPRVRGAFVRVAYTGVWRPGYGPNDLYDAIRYLKGRGSACLQSLRLTTAGFAPGQAREYGIEAFVEELGQVPHARAIDIIQRADALYLPVSKGLHETVSVPGKLFDYIGSNTPILASVPPGSEAAAVLASVGGAAFFEPGDVAGLACALERLCHGGGEALFSERVPHAAGQYERRNLTKKLAAVLNRVCVAPT